MVYNLILKHLFRSFSSDRFFLFLSLSFGAEKIQWCTEYSASLSCTFKSSLLFFSFFFLFYSICFCFGFIDSFFEACAPSFTNNEVTNKSDHCEFNECLWLWIQYSMFNRQTHTMWCDGSIFIFIMINMYTRFNIAIAITIGGAFNLLAVLMIHRNKIINNQKQ